MKIKKLTRKLTAALAALAIAAAPLPAVMAADSTPTPVLRYNFDTENPLADLDSGKELTLSGGASITEDGNTGKALLLDGVDGCALLPENILTDTMTVTAWVKINKFTTWGRVFDFGEDANNNFFFAPYSGGAARIEMKSPQGAYTMDTAQETERDWVHYAVTISGDTVSCYRNGRLIQSKSGMGKLSDIKNTLNYIGKSHYDGDAYLAAAVDDFRVYNTALGRNDVCNVMAEGKISSDILFKSYAIEDGQLVTGNTIDLPALGALTWTEKDNLGLVNTETGAVKHNAKTEAVTLTAAIGDDTRDYTVYVTGTDENPYTVNIDASDRTNKISDTMWGLFFEDINSAADGGLYAEMVQNRSFEMDDPLYSWETEGDIKVNTENSLNENNPTYITMSAGSSIINDGFSGMSIKKDETYNFSMYIKRLNYSLNIELINENGEVIASGKLGAGGGISSGLDDETIKELSTQWNSWRKREITLEPTSDAENAKLRITVLSKSDPDIDMISLIPEDTYKGHGLRKDLMEQLEAMHPSFLRFPGGCAVEGQTMDKAWNWKDTIGDVSERKEMINIWNPSATEPYMMTYGLGFYEYFQMCEDLGMEPVPILNCGMACQVRSGSATDSEHLVPMDELQPYIDDALDLIAFANGTDETNEWTKKRIDMGHPEPFNMKYIGIGNEQYGDIYFERYAEFARQIHEKYPDINLVTTSGTASSGTSNDLAWNWANENTELADIMDEHYYETADWFRTHAYRYDNYRRDTNTKVFLGEYASKGNTWYNALSEAAFMTGLERNADVVKMASYAPMFAKYGNTQWSAANMIWFNNDDFVLTPNYHVQSLFSNNRGDYSLPTEVKMNGVEKDNTLHGGIVVGSWGTHNEFKDVSVAGTGDNGITADVSTKDGDWIFGSGDWSVNEEGSLVQSGDATGSTAWIDSPDANNYTVTLKAKKTAGGEGFQVGVAAEDGQNYYRVNIGGWGNTTAKVQHIVNGVSAETGNVAEQSYVGDVHINDNEWYDVRVEVSDYEIKAYLNDKFICSYIKPQQYGPVYASSTYDEETGEVIVKLVNTMDSDVNVGLNITGAEVADFAETTVMSGDTSLENSLENKYAIIPVEGGIVDVANEFTYNAEANSLSIIHLHTRGNTSGKTAYISGYTDGTFRPDSTITRAETAAIIARLQPDFDENTNYSSRLNDITPDKWYAKYVNFAAQKGYISGYEDGSFKPENTITRAEMAAILKEYANITERAEAGAFKDISGHWAEEAIGACFALGYVSGYEDNTFKPDNTITRAEAVTMINKTIGRDADNITAYTQNPFKDVTPSHWAYNQILTAVQ